LSIGGAQASRGGCAERKTEQSPNVEMMGGLANGVRASHDTDATAAAFAARYPGRPGGGIRPLSGGGELYAEANDVNAGLYFAGGSTSGSDLHFELFIARRVRCGSGRASTTAD
jgi:hypothetical protein